jgi:AraC-like DNA-binding protein
MRSEEAFQVFRLLRACVDVQREPHLSVSDMAYSCGYSDDAALRTAMRNVMGTTPTEVRQHLGWEWLLCQALHRGGIHTQKCK